MKKWGVVIAGILFLLSLKAEVLGQGPDLAQKRILVERGEKVRGNRLELVKTVVESYRDCHIISKGNELVGLVINGKTYQDFTLVIREAKRTIIVVTVDGIISFDY